MTIPVSSNGRSPMTGQKPTRKRLPSTPAAVQLGAKVPRSKYDWPSARSKKTG